MGSPKQIAWDRVRERLRENELALEKAATPDPERVSKIYRERAARLARRPASAESFSGGTTVLVFRIGTERYAIELGDLAEVIANPQCTLVPGSAPALAGVINFRGEIRPVWDLARLLKIPGSENNDPGHVLLLRRPGQEAGLKVDRAEQIRALEAQDWNQAGQPSPYIKGVTSDAISVIRTEALLKEELSL